MSGIDWESVVRQHSDFTRAGPDPEYGLLISMRDGCGEALYVGANAWYEAAEHIGFKRDRVEATDIHKEESA